VIDGVEAGKVNKRREGSGKVRAGDAGGAADDDEWFMIDAPFLCPVHLCDEKSSLVCMDPSIF